MRPSPIIRTNAGRVAARIGILAALAASAAGAQRAPRPAAPPEPADAPAAPDAPAPPDWSRVRVSSGAARTYLGVTLIDVSSPDDTIGVLLDTVEDDQPAAKAGIRGGARLVSFDGVNLQLDPGDIGDAAAEALPATRLRRVLARKNPGDTVTAVVAYGRRRETRTVVLAESPVARSLRATSSGRRMLGVGFSERGSMRDTAGLLITSLTNGGGAEKAGLLEGDRVVSIDGVDLRVPAADAGSSEAVQARVARLRRALDGSTDSSPVRLEVLSEGRRRTVSVTPTWSRGFTIDMDRIRGMADDIRTSVRSNFRTEFRDERDDDDRAQAQVEARIEARRGAAEAQREAARGVAEAQREAARARAERQREAARERARVLVEIERDRSDRWRDERDGDDDADDDRRASAPVRGIIRGRTDGSTLSIAGLSLAVVDLDFARQFGRGAEDGALVVRSRRDWEPLRAGDMILTIEGRSVRSGSNLEITIDRGRDQKFEVLRGGNRIMLVVPAVR